MHQAFAKAIMQSKRILLKTALWILQMPVIYDGTNELKCLTIDGGCDVYRGV